MTLRKKLIPALCAVTILLLAACGGGANNGAAGGATGIAACDDYLAKIDKCILNNADVPEQVKTSYRSTLDQSRAAWKAAAANPTTKAQTESACKQAMETAKPSFDKYCK